MMKLVLSLLFTFIVSFAGFTPVLAEQEYIESIVPVSVSFRDSGYVLGDFVKVRAYFSLPAKLKLDSLSLPLKGPVNSWVDLRDIQLEQQTTETTTDYTITYTWQLFATVQKAQKIQLPQIILQTLPVSRSGEKVAKPKYIFADVEDIYYSPVFSSLMANEKPLPFIKPTPFDSKTPLLLGLLSISIFWVLLLFWFWLEDKISFWPRHPGAMTKLYRKLSRQRKKSQFSQKDIALIQSALAQSARQSLYPHTLTNLFDNAAYLSEFEAEIKLFFSQAWQAMYIDDAVKNQIVVADTLGWIYQASIKERLHQIRTKR